MCPVGYYCWAGISEPQACSNGTYCPTPGRSTDGDPCLSGYYCSTPLTQTPCTSNHYCPTGSMTPIQCSSCPPGKPLIAEQCTAQKDTVCTSDESGGSNQGAIIGGSVSASIIVVLLAVGAFYWYNQKKKHHHQDMTELKDNVSDTAPARRKLGSSMMGMSYQDPSNTELNQPDGLGEYDTEKGKANEELPPGWKKYMDEKSGIPYYSNGVQTMWEPPAGTTS